METGASFSLLSWNGTQSKRDMEVVRTPGRYMLCAHPKVHTDKSLDMFRIRLCAGGEVSRTL